MAEENINEREENAIEKVNNLKKNNFHYLPTIQIVLLTCFTCGLYTYYLIYKCHFGTFEAYCLTVTHSILAIRRETPVRKFKNAWPGFMLNP